MQKMLIIYQMATILNRRSLSKAKINFEQTNMYNKHMASGVIILDVGWFSITGVQLSASIKYHVILTLSTSTLP